MSALLVGHTMTGESGDDAAETEPDSATRTPMQPDPRPVPGLEPQPIDMEQYYALTPEKLELWSGYLFDGPDEHQSRRDLLLALLINEGLEAAVHLAPAELWLEALRGVERES
jgi:hypothetical protein